VTRQSDRPMARCSDGSAVDLLGVRVQVFHHSYDAGAAIANRLKAAFHLAEIALAGSDKVLSMQRSNDYERHGDDGLWQFAVDFDCTVYLTSGV
jgi:hypothetical protein